LRGDELLTADRGFYSWTAWDRAAASGAALLWRAPTQLDLPVVRRHDRDHDAGLSLSAFRGGPVFPSMFIGAAIGIAASGLPGMELAPAIGMGIGAMCTAMLRLPLTSTLLAILLLGADGLSVTPEIIVAVVVAYVVTNTLPVPGPKEPTVPPAGTRPLGAPPPAPAPA